MRNKYFSIIEMSVVLFVILVLLTISVSFYRTVQRSILNKSQIMEFENIKTAINAYKIGVSKSTKASSKYVTIYDLIYTHSLLSEKRTLLINGKDKTKADAEIKSYFDTPIEVWVKKIKNSGRPKTGETPMDCDFVQITDHKFLTGNFEFYFGNDHEVDGGEVGTKFGLPGDGTKDDGHQYYYWFVYQEPDNGPKHNFKMH